MAVLEPHQVRFVFKPSQHNDRQLAAARESKAIRLDSTQYTQTKTEPSASTSSRTSKLLGGRHPLELKPCFGSPLHWPC
jgi:hypothetical protein